MDIPAIAKPPRRLGWRAGLLAVAIAATAFALFDFDRATLGVPEFYVWQALSGLGHGGRTADIDGVRIYYETFGQGPPVLVLHGGMGVTQALRIGRYYKRALMLDSLHGTADWALEALSELQ